MLRHHPVVILAEERPKGETGKENTVVYVVQCDRGMKSFCGDLSREPARCEKGKKLLQGDSVKQRPPTTFSCFLLPSSRHQESVGHNNSGKIHHCFDMSHPKPMGDLRRRMLKNSDVVPRRPKQDFGSASSGGELHQTRSIFPRKYLPISAHVITDDAIQWCNNEDE